MKRRIFAIFCVFVLIALDCPSYATASNDAPELISESALLLDPVSGQVLYSKNPDEQRAPASLTKITTVMTVLSLCEDPDHTEITVPDGVFDEIYAVGGSRTDPELVPGEVLTATQLLYATMLPSACDAASTLAYHFGDGSIGAFVEKMNEFARSCGAENTHYVNAHGLDAPGHLSTANDIVKILRVALQNETFNRIISTTRYLIPATNLSKAREISYETTIPMLYTYNDTYYEGLRGVKSGTTRNAGYCLSCLCDRKNYTLLALCMHGGDLENGVNHARTEVLSLFDWGFANYVKTVGVKAGERYASVNLEGATESEVSLVTRRDISLLKDQTGGDLSYFYKVPQSVSPPFSDEPVGTLSVVQNGVELINEPLYFEHLPTEFSAPQSAENAKGTDLTLVILLAVIVLLVFVFILLHRSARKNLSDSSAKRGRRS